MPKTAGSSINDILLKYADTEHVNEPRITRSITHVPVDVTWDKYYSRVVSHYNFLTRLGYIDKPFKDFILDKEPTQFRLLNLNGKIPLSFVGKFENLEKDFNHIADKINIIERYSDLGYIYQSKKVDYKQYYTEELKHLVDDIHDNDFKHFGYEKKL
jgi:hypothetical protein